MTPELKAKLQSLGYMVLRIEPTIWRVRGEGDENDWYGKGKWIDVWALHGLYRAYNQSGKAQPYTDLIATVSANLKPWTPRTAEAEYVFQEWKQGLVLARSRFPQLVLAVK